MRRIILIAVLCAFVALPVSADLTFYGPSDKLAFEASASIAFVEDFASVTPKNTYIPSFVSNGVTYTGLAGVPIPNVWVAEVGTLRFGQTYLSPGSGFLPTSHVLTANGQEDFTIDMTALGSPVTAVGFDTYLNQFGPATITIVAGGSSTPVSHSHDYRQVGFFGVTSTSPIDSIRWTATQGELIDTGIGNVQVGVVPVPGALLLGMIGLSVAGVKLRKRA